MAKTLYPILRQVVRLAAHRASAVIGLAWSDSKSIENPAERRRPGGYELFVDDPDGLTARGMEPVLPSGIPFDNAATRCDMASFKASARSLDQGVGTVLNALEENGVADQTLVVLTTDHGLAYPDANATMFDSGIGTILLMRGPGGFDRGRVFDTLVSHLDIYPTLCEVAGIERPEWLEGQSLVPLVRKQVEAIRQEVFAELTFHAAYGPQRAVRTQRYKYMRRFDASNPHRVLANVDDSPTKEVMVSAGWVEVDPLLLGPVAPAPDTFYNTVDQESPSDPTTQPWTHSATLTRRARTGGTPPSDRGAD
jgi:hypothetical protein